MASNGTDSFQKGLFRFVNNRMLRTALEVFFSSVPGAAIIFIFLLGTGVLNIYSNLSQTNDTFATLYIPIVCLLPIFVGIVGPLILERVRGEAKLPLRGSVLVSAFSAFAGSLLSSLVLVATGIASADFKPFGGAIPDSFGILPGMLGAFVILVAVCTLLSSIGGALIVVILNRVEK